MRIYIAGPMRGIADFNFPAFHGAAESLRLAGHDVFNPAEHDVNGGFDPEGMTGHEDLAVHGFDLRKALAADTEWISLNAHAICVLPGWETSRGARAEMTLAAALGLRAGSVRDLIYTDTDIPYALDLLNPPPSVVHADAPTGEVRVTNTTTGGEKGSKEQRFDLVPIGPLTLLATLYGRGASKYADRNWERGYDYSLSYAAMQRHATQWWAGEDLDPEMHLSHLASVAWHAFTLMQFEVQHPELDNRPGRGM